MSPVLTVVEDLEHVRVAHPGDGLRLTLEAGEELLSLGQIGFDDLEPRRHG